MMANPKIIASFSPVAPLQSTSKASDWTTAEAGPSQRVSQHFEPLSKWTAAPRKSKDTSPSWTNPLSINPRLINTIEEPSARLGPAVAAANIASQRPRRALPAIPGAVNDIHSFVPPAAEAGGRFARLATMLGVNRKGVHPVSLFSKKPMNSMLNAASTNLHGDFPYDAAPVTEVVNSVATGATAIAAHKVKDRYELKVNDMLADDLRRFELVSIKPQTPLNRGLVDYQDLTPAQKRLLKNDPTIPENQILTTDGKGNWQYDKAKLARIASDTSHPQCEHARDVLAALSVAENKSKQKHGALLQTVSSAVGVAATSAQIAGTHGAIVPALVAGHAGLAGKETFDLRKPFVDARQIMRNEKSDEVMRLVNRRMAEMPPMHDEVPIQAKAGMYATAFEGARAKAAEQSNFGFKVSGNLINDRKSAAVKSDAQDLANKHIAAIVQNGMKGASESSLARLGYLDKHPGLTRSQREKEALNQIGGDANLRAVHTLLTDTGISKGDAAILISKMGEQSLVARTAGGRAASSGYAGENATRPLTANEERVKIANLIGEPSLKPADPFKDTEGKIKSSLALRS